MPPSDEPHSYFYHAFLSYSTSADYTAARELEAFLESLHKTPTQNGEPLPALQLCRDGSDFQLPRGARRAAAGLTEPLWDIIEPELRRSKYLLVLCCPESVRSTWVEKEVNWFLKHRGPDFVLVAVTAGDDPIKKPDAVFPPAVREAHLDTARIWYDLRKRRRQKTAGVVRDYDDERVRLAGDLLEWDAPQKGALSTTWQRAQRRQMRRVLTAVAAAALLLAVIAGAAVWQRAVAMDRLRDFHVLTFQSLTMNGQYDLAAQTLDGIALDDPRLRVAGWFAKLHHSYPSRISPPLAADGLHALAFEPESGILAALSGDRLLILDPEKEAVVSSTPLPRHADRLVAADRPSTFYAYGSETLIRCRYLDGGWGLDVMRLPAGVEDLSWFHRTNLGLALTDRQALLLEAGEGLRPLKAVFPKGSGLHLVASLDHSMIGIATRRQSMLGDFRVDESDFHEVFVIRDGKVQTVPLPGKPPVAGHLVGQELFASGLKDDGLRVVRFTDGLEIETRPIFYKTWVGALVWLPGAIFVQEVGDSTTDIIARLAVLDLSTGQDLIEGPLVDEPVWAYAADPRGARHFFGGQNGRLTRVTQPADGVKTMALAHRVAGPFRTLEGGILLRAESTLDRRVWQVDAKLQTIRLIEDHYPEVSNKTPTGGFITWQHYPFVFDRSPGGTRIALGGDRLRIVQLPESLAGPGHSLEDLSAFAESILLANDQAILWEVPIDPPSTIRWLSDDLLLAHDFHGGALLIDVRAQSHSQIDIRNDAVTGVTPRGPFLVSTLAGRVWQIDRTGKATLLAQVPNLEELFPLDDELRLFVGRSTRPKRTAFFVRRRDRLEEVAAVSNVDRLLDAGIVGDKLVLLYPKSLRVYSSPLGLLESDSFLGDDPRWTLQSLASTIQHRIVGSLSSSDLPAKPSSPPLASSTASPC